MLLGGVQSGSDGIDASCGNRRALWRPVLKAFFSFGDTDIKSVGARTQAVVMKALGTPLKVIS
jgi:hypothetical protein